MISHSFLSLLNRRGVWMTAVEIFDASSADYPVGDYVLADLATLKANGLILSRRRQKSTLLEYGLPEWEPAPKLSVRDVLQMIHRLIRRMLAAA